MARNKKARNSRKRKRKAEAACDEEKGPPKRKSHRLKNSSDAPTNSSSCLPGCESKPAASAKAKSKVAATKKTVKEQLVWISHDRLPPPCSDGSYFPPIFRLPKKPSERMCLRLHAKSTSSANVGFQIPSPEAIQLSPTHIDCWNHKYAASACIQNRSPFPFGVYRCLGTITRPSVHLRNNNKVKKPFGGSRQNPRFSELHRRPQSITIATAKKLAVAELGDAQSEQNIARRAQKIQDEWREILQQDAFELECPWNYAGILDWQEDKAYMDPITLKARLHPKEKEFLDVLDACQDIGDVQSLWKIPLLVVYPVVVAKDAGGKLLDIEAATKAGRKLFDVEMAVYIHRMLPEVNSVALKIVLEALDVGSYLCPRPRVSVPQRDVFVSSPYPQVVTDDKEIYDLEQIAAKNEEGDKGTEKISAFSTEGLLKLWENTGTDVQNYHAQYEERVRSGLQLELMLYQIHGVSWMLQMEALESINDLLWEEREFWDGGTYYCCPPLGQIRLERPAKYKGGLLCDTMGLGKTIEIIALIVATMPETISEAMESGGNHATLIIVPPALVAQWIAEIRKCVGDSFLAVDYFDYRTGTTERRLGDTTRAADVVVTTYKSLDKQSSSKILQEEAWARIVLDEMQEIRSSTTMIAKSCEKLSASRRWMLSGTPLFDGIQDLRGELNFLKLCPFAASNEDGFFKFMIGDPWENQEIAAIERLQLLSTILLRRSKSMTVLKTGRSILDQLPSLTVEFVPVQQTDSERALYYFMEWVTGMEGNAADSSHRRLCLRLLREFCFSPVRTMSSAGALLTRVAPC